MRQRLSVEAIYKQFLWIMAFFSFGALVILVTRMVSSGNQRFGFLFWNLFLAWIPALAGLWFARRRQHRRRRIVAVVLFLVWLGFLPNTFYILSDFIHLRPLGDINILFDVVLLFVFSSLGFLLGLAALGIMHAWLKRYLTSRSAAIIIFTTIFLCSFAIYLGRYLRWNSWDVVANPLGLLVDVSDRVISPLDHPRTLSTTFLFFALIGSSYSAVWWAADFFHKSLGGLIVKSKD